MQTVEKPRRSVWMYGYESEEPTEEQRRAYAREMSARLGVDIRPPPKPRLEDLRLRPPRVTPPGTVAEFSFQDTYERALHSHGGYRERALLGRFPNPPDVVAHPRSEQELEAVLEWCSKGGYAVIPYGGGS
ncbi:MAG: FAD-binding oxidoreductase [Dehalococcoidia bacterium]|nr:FAD-binding oxidoreductase [Dehalococcoidia bacterium]